MLIEVADERLYDVEANDLSNDNIPTNSRIVRDHANICSLAASLARLAREEIEKLKASPANHPETIERQKKELELLNIFANGFEEIVRALSSFEVGDTKALAKVEKAVLSVGRQVERWCSENASQMVDWAVRIPVIAGGVALLGWAGADTTISTAVVSAIVGGPTVVEAIKKSTK